MSGEKPAPDPAEEERPPNPRRDYWVAELVRRGMTEARAELLTASPVDLHAVAAALDAGCVPDMAWQIWNVELAPTPAA